MYLKYQIQNTKTQPKRNETKQKQNKCNKPQRNLKPTFH